MAASSAGVFGCGRRAASAGAPWRVRAASRIGAKGETGIDWPHAWGGLWPHCTTSPPGGLPSRTRQEKLCPPPQRVDPDYMPHASSLIATIVSGIGLAFIFGTIANRLRVSPLVGY